MTLAAFVFLFGFASMQQDAPARVSPPTPEEWSAIRAMMLPDLLKNADQFRQESRTLASFRSRGAPDKPAQDTINKQTKLLEDRIERILDYLLDGENAPNPPRDDPSATFAEHLNKLDTIASEVVRNIQQYAADQRRGAVDAQRETGLVQDLQSVRLLARDLRRDIAPENHSTTGRVASLPLPPRNEATGMQFVRIPAGEFTMGCINDDRRCDRDELPAHRVQITKEFEIGVYEVTQAEWETVMGSNPSHFKGEDLPVEQVSWNDVQEFLRKLTAKNDGYRYRLPTEAEWEYAARADTSDDRAESLDAIAWYYDNSDSHTHPVGLKEPNAWGLYDTIGNVWEWVQDWYDPEYYQSSMAVDPAGPANGQTRILRGGSWYYMVPGGRISYRDYTDPDGGYDGMGFRCVREAIAKSR